MISGEYSKPRERAKKISGGQSLGTSFPYTETWDLCVYGVNPNMADMFGPEYIIYIAHWPAFYGRFAPLYAIAYANKH